MKITKLMLLLFTLFIFDNLHYQGLSKHTYKSWSLRRALISRSKRKSINIAAEVYKFIKDKIDLSSDVLFAGFSALPVLVRKENHQPIQNYVFARMCI